MKISGDTSSFPINTPFSSYEEKAHTGGNCITFSHGDYRFDSGAHRFHGRDPDITGEMKALLGESLKKIDIPSKIYDGRQVISFPPTPFGMLKSMSFGDFLKASFQVAANRFLPRKAPKNFESFARQTYGSIIASRFLLNYTEKLWGRPGSLLSTAVAGNRLEGLSLKTIIAKFIFNPNSLGEHYEGSFLYPEGGIAAISRKLSEMCGNERILLNSRATRILHDGRRITGIEINGERKVDIERVIATIPLNVLIDSMDPPVPAALAEHSRCLQYRHIRLLCFFIDRQSVTSDATLYFPHKEYLFTRLFEPRNRDITMSPRGKTSIVAEVPCNEDNDLWNMNEEEFIERIGSQVLSLKLIEENEIEGTATEKLSNAYPVLYAGCEEKVRALIEYLNSFSNLKLAGRIGRFHYTWIHEIMRAVKEIIEDYSL